MKTQTFTASISQEDEWFIAQCLEVDVASQGKSEDEAVDNLREALELYFEPPRPTVMPKLRKFEVNINSDETTSHRQIKRKLEKAGFTLIHQRGSHVKFVRESGGEVRTVIVPNHREVRIERYGLFCAMQV